MDKEVKVEQFDEALIDWAKNVYIRGEFDDLVHLGTVIRINNNIVVLQGYTDQQLDLLVNVVSNAVRCEKSLREKKNDY